jgi:hypothetical protein
MRKGYICYSFHILKSISLAVLFWAWIIFLSWKIPTRITPHTGDKWKFQWEKMKRPWESRKGKRAQETHWLGGMPKSQERVITKIKWVYPRKAMKRKKGESKKSKKKKRGTTQRVELLIVILSLWNPKTLFELYDLFFHNQKLQPTLRACRSPF